MPDIVDKANDLVSLSEELALREIRSMGSWLSLCWAPKIEPNVF